MAEKKNRTYSELKNLKTFEERFRYLKLNSKIGEDTFGFDRYLNQKFYTSQEWRKVRDKIILRDDGCDLGIPDRIIFDKILIHHINPISQNDLRNITDILLDEENLICVSHRTHNALHYGDESILQPSTIVDRKQNDTKLW